MASEIVLPQWGMEMQDGTIVRWLKQEGDTVAEGEPIVEVETAKLQTELESTASGVLSRIVAQEGQIVPIRGVLCVIAEPGEEIAAPAAPAAQTSAPSVAATQVATAANGAGAPGGPGGARRPSPGARARRGSHLRCEAADPTGAFCWPMWSRPCRLQPRRPPLLRPPRDGSGCPSFRPPAVWRGRTTSTSRRSPAAGHRAGS